MFSKLILTSCLLISTLVNSSTPQTKTFNLLLGKWNIVKAQVGDEETTDEGVFIDFNKDGSYLSNDDMKSSWKISTDAKYLILGEGDSGDDGEYLIEEISKDEVVIFKDPLRLTLRKS